MLCQGDERVGVATIFGEEGRAIELRPCLFPTLAHWKKTKRERGKLRDSDERFYAGGRDDNFKEDVGSSSSSEVRNMEEEFGTGFQMERGIRENPLFRSPLSGNFSREDASRSAGKGLIFEGICEIPGARNLEVCQPSPSQPPESSSFPSCSLDSPLSSPFGPHLPNSVPLSQSPTENQVISKKNSEKGVVDSLNYGDIPVCVEEENQCALSNQMSESCTHRESNVRSYKEDSGDLLIDGLSPRKMAKVREVLCSLDIKVYSRRKNKAPQVIETWWFWLGRLGPLCFSMKIISWNIRGLGSRNKRRMVKDFLRSENPDVVDDSETKKEKYDRRFVGSVWTVRNKDWVALPALGHQVGF
ncbi:hypothetical protein CK203_064981 [Vitis vinifera]|uniref:DUF4283 domain-containing protein n=1 Tax=Vitis vinifera TaxID=29760 RepID=A0A438G2T7_VITVI|nr:hypothetical protein CK203_064981 [Vitis vinifera]